MAQSRPKGEVLTEEALNRLVDRLKGFPQYVKGKGESLNKAAICEAAAVEGSSLDPKTLNKILGRERTNLVSIKRVFSLVSVNENDDQAFNQERDLVSDVDDVNSSSHVEDKSPEGLHESWSSMIKILDSDGKLLGSGFVINCDGYCVTSHHIIANIDTLTIQYKDNIYPAKWCSDLTNIETGISILKISETNIEPVSLSIPKDQVVNAFICGFTRDAPYKFSQSCDLYGTLDRNLLVETSSLFDEATTNYSNPWNEKPSDNSLFQAYTVQANEYNNDKFLKELTGSLVLDSDSGFAVGLFQVSRSGTAYVSSWENISDQLGYLKVEPERAQIFATTSLRTLSSNILSEVSPDSYLPEPAYKYLLGRNREIQAIKNILCDSNMHKIVALTGIGGIGKTALVREVIKSYSSLGFNEVFWMTASVSANSDGMTFETITDGLIRQLNRPDLCKLDQDDRQLAIRDILHDYPTLIVLDNMETSIENQNIIVEKLFNIIGSSKAVLTSRHRFLNDFLDNIFPLYLTGIDKEFALNLMLNTARRKSMLDNFNSVNEKDLNRMIEATGGGLFGYVPMALNFILGQLQKFDPEVIIDGLAGVRLTSDDGELSDKDEFKQFWKAIFLNSLKVLTPLDKKFMSGMTLFEPNIGSRHQQIMSSLDLKNEEFRQAVDSTWKVSFLEIGQKERSKSYYMHRLSYLFFSAIITNLVDKNRKG